MRRRTEKYEKDSAEIDMTPMLDIVFIMLIFFIVTATFVREFGLDVTPAAGNDTMDPPPAILVQITESNGIMVNRRAVDQRAVRANIERLVAESPQSAVLLQAERGAETGLLISVMDQAELANAAAVSVAPVSRL